MTRENKLALVLGFGLMLFVGILVSDHLAARQLAPVATTLASRDSGVPPLPPPGTDPNIIMTGGSDGSRVVAQLPGGSNQAPDDARANEDARKAAGQDGSGAGPGTVVLRPTDGAPDGGNASGPSSPTATERTYLIKQGDTFAAIAQREYGKRSLGQALADFNSMNPSRLKVGATVKLPTLAAIDPASTLARNDSSVAPSTPPSPQFKVYKVQQGDTLFRIAQRELGKGDRWKELQSSNSELLKDADGLTPGMQIKIPVMTASADRPTDA